MTSLNIPVVDRMMVRKIKPTGLASYFGGVLVLDTYDVESVGLAESRSDYDADEVDCSNRIFQITTMMMMHPDAMLAWTAFPSRRWRNFRTGEYIDRDPDREHPLLYIGNPVRLTKDERGISVIGRGEFIIKSGPELGY